MHYIEKIVPVALAVILASSAVADETEEQNQKRRGPPAVAFEACVAAVDGDACAFDSRRGDSLSGICSAGRAQELVCRPDNAPPRFRRKDREEIDREDRVEESTESE